jgi:3-methyladenine DNA glycosylase/8-oxoguanine DNA glycosylase
VAASQTLGRLLEGDWSASPPAKSALKFHGIGKWTAQCVAMQALGKPDAVPSDDLGLCATALGSSVH